MTHMNLGSRKGSIVCTVLLAAAVLYAAPASAEPTDDAFFAALAKDGIVITNRNSAIALARTVCAGFDQNEKSSVLDNSANWLNPGPPLM
jgi:hypothetical protein